MGQAPVSERGGRGREVDDGEIDAGEESRVRVLECHSVCPPGGGVSLCEKKAPRSPLHLPTKASVTCHRALRSRGTALSPSALRSLLPLSSALSLVSRSVLQVQPSLLVPLREPSWL